MNTMNLNAAGVLELSAVEMREVDGGGFIKVAFEIAKDIYENWETYANSFNEGFAAGRKAVK